MIDTDEFEGHTLHKPIQMDEPDSSGSREMVCDGGIVGWLMMDNYPSANVDAKLIAAAPDLLAEVKRLRVSTYLRNQLLVEAAHCIHEMEGMAYAHADPDDFAKHAMEFRGNVSEMIGADALWGEEE
jgi:hypothetical protein